MNLTELQKSVEALTTTYPLINSKLTAIEMQLAEIKNTKLTYSLKEAAKETGLSVNLLRDLFTAGKITGIYSNGNNDGKILLHAHSLKAYLNIPQIGL